MKRLIIYDLDGTLADTSQELVLANAYVLSQLAASPGHADAETAEAWLATYYAHHAYEHSRLYPGARALLGYFHGRTQAILTERPNPFARELMEVLGILGDVADLIAGDSPYPGKPHPASALALMARAGVTPAEALLIGDRAIDVETGRRAGICTVAVAHDRAMASALRASGPDVLAEDLPHLLALAKRHGW